MRRAEFAGLTLLVALSSCRSTAGADPPGAVVDGGYDQAAMQQGRADAASDVVEPDAPADHAGGEGTTCGSPDDYLFAANGFGAVTGCTRFRGSLTIGDVGLPEMLLPLRDLVEVDGTVTFFRSHGLKDCRGLDRLEIVGGDLSLRFNSQSPFDTERFTSLAGLERLHEVGGLWIEANPELRSLAALAALQIVHGNVHIERNVALPSAEIAALLARVRVEGEVVVTDNQP